MVPHIHTHVHVYTMYMCMHRTSRRMSSCTNVVANVHMKRKLHSFEQVDKCNTSGNLQVHVHVHVGESKE